MSLAASRADTHIQANRDLDPIMSRSSAEDGEQREIDEEHLLAQKNMLMVSTFPSLTGHGGFWLSALFLAVITANSMTDQRAAGFGHWETRICDHT